ncbi:MULTISPECIES: hypothetical protein [unclassified Erwinia]|nr:MULTISPECIES: hypothetical protein [unclassified Erwinia]
MAESKSAVILAGRLAAGYSARQPAESAGYAVFPPANVEKMDNFR